MNYLFIIFILTKLPLDVFSIFLTQSHFFSSRSNFFQLFVLPLTFWRRKKEGKSCEIDMMKKKKLIHVFIIIFVKDQSEKKNSCKHWQFFIWKAEKQQQKKTMKMEKWKWKMFGASIIKLISHCVIATRELNGKSQSLQSYHNRKKVRGQINVFHYEFSPQKNSECQWNECGKK